MSEANQFEVIVTSGWLSPDAWDRAQRAPVSELPTLDPAEKEYVRRLGTSEEDHARDMLARHLGREWTEQRGRELGLVIQRLVGSQHDLRAVIAERNKDRWIARFVSGERPVNIAIPRELVDEVLDSETVQGREQLENLLYPYLEKYGAKTNR